MDGEEVLSYTYNANFSSIAPAGVDWGNSKLQITIFSRGLSAQSTEAPVNLRLKNQKHSTVEGTNHTSNLTMYGAQKQSTTLEAAEWAGRSPRRAGAEFLLLWEVPF